MRHLYGTALAVVMAAAMFFGGTWGYLRLLRLPVPAGLPAAGGSLLSNSTALLGLAAVLATAVLAGLLAVLPRFSPLAAGLPGLLLLAWTGLYLASERSAVQFIPLRSHAFGAGWEALLSTGMLGAAGAVMVIPMLLPSRWRSPHQAAVAARVSEDTARAEAHQAPLIADVTSQWAPQREEPPLVGTVVGGRPVGDVRPVDTSHVTGASRALRNTGSFRMATGAQPRATGSFRAAQDHQGRPWRPHQREYRAADE